VCGLVEEVRIDVNEASSATGLVGPHIQRRLFRRCESRKQRAL
jgi:hypothetical protein